ncbi:hypothetical protein FRC14_001467 [Serendipita sp. 396]|nr:hypothetical protein FRC14_001467 [Serendipita sp. 396]KAG8774208.1 hypothetical protein FRC15_001502 [Serendipita sp. 397]KAG8788969.1 hypothetical protein FRC16_001284 [Serendipita sp. 398]KAG8852879.1 hypothetical protein FRC20_001381 [Serendipita sp. 405]
MRFHFVFTLLAATAALVASVALPAHPNVASVDPESKPQIHLVKRVPPRPYHTNLSPQVIASQSAYHANLAHHYDTIRVAQESAKNTFNYHAGENNRLAGQAAARGEHTEAAILRATAQGYTRQAETAETERANAAGMSHYHGNTSSAYGHTSRGEFQAATNLYRTALSHLPPMPADARASYNK